MSASRPADWLLLNIDDEQGIRYVKTRTLQRAGYRVIEATTGEEGLQSVESHRPDLVLCDVKLPDIDGFEVCRRIKDRHPDILVLQVSASFVSAQNRADGLDHGADSYLTEPVEPAELVASVRALLRMKRAEDELRDLTDRLAHEVEVRTRERDRLWSVSNELLAVLDGGMQVVARNPAWETALGLTEADVAGREFASLVDPSDRVLARAALAALQEGSTSRFLGRMRGADGAVHWVDWVVNRDEARAYAFGRDVTDERARQKELESAQAQLRQSQKMEALGQLTGGIAHDFNNLLTGIIGGLDLVRRSVAQGNTTNVTTFLDLATSSARRAAALTNRLLVFSRMKSLHYAVVDVTSLVASMDELLRQSIGENVVLESDLPEEAWPVEIDPNQFEIALLNVVLNARDAMPDGGTVRIALSNQSFAAAASRETGAPVPGDYLCVSVTDTGSGMPAEVVEKAFDPFFTTKPSGQGTGLGLAMVYGFAKQAHGHVRLTSNVGVGTTVQVYLPRFRGGDATEAAVAAAPVVRAVQGTVLLTEDDLVVRSVVRSVLEDMGYDVLEAGTGEEALAVIERDTPVDLLLTDIGLPGRTGVEVARMARVRRPDLPVLYMTGYAEMLREESLQGERSVVVAKPFDTGTLAERIRQVMRG